MTDKQLQHPEIFQKVGSVIYPLLNTAHGQDVMQANLRQHMWLQFAFPSNYFWSSTGNIPKHNVDGVKVHTEDAASETEGKPSPQDDKSKLRPPLSI